MRIPCKSLSRSLSLLALSALVLALPVLAQNAATQPVPRPDEWWTNRHNGMNERVKQGNVDLVFIGDSITQGWEGEGAPIWEEYYGDRNAVNLGISGDRTEHVLWRLENGNIEGISPKLAVIMIGTNNASANEVNEIADGIRAIVGKLQNDLPDMKILLLGIFPRENTPGEIRAKMDAVNTSVSELADNYKTFYLDIGREFLQPDGTLPPEIMPDFLHPNAEGYKIWAAAIEPLVSRLLGEMSPGNPPKGYVSLFNGKDLTGWKGLVGNPESRAAMSQEELAEAQAAADEAMRAHWNVEENGLLLFDGQGSHLCTGQDYEDFDMIVDWKIEHLGDSGVYLRGSPQVQIWDPAQWPQGSGGLYNNKTHPSNPLVFADNPTEKWNQFRITMVGENVSVWLNNKLVVDDTPLENYWDETRQKPIYDSEQIELQAHGSRVWFNNVYIKELPRGEGWVDLFNGKDLSGWEQVGGETQGWAAEDGILYTTGVEGAGWLSTTEEYGDFELSLEFRVPVNGNSGVFIRAPREGNPAFEGSEIQVLDDYGSEYTTLEPYQYTGSVYATVAPSRRVTRPAGEWQKMYIRAEGQQVTVKVNGKETINANLDEHLDKAADHPGLKRSSGYIGLQNHGSRLDYRNIRIRKLGQ